jgi:uncharacterized membrane protein
MYLALKSLHIIAVVLFLGNVITGVFWKSHADQTGDPRIIAHTLDGIIRSDRWFTIPGVIMILIFGLGAAAVGHIPILRTAWIWQSLILFGISGAAFMSQVAPLQVRLRSLARAGVSTGSIDKAEYDRLSRRWEVWGAIAVIASLIALGLMVTKAHFGQ